MSQRFPGDFKWGLSTSSYQLEGGVKCDGRGESIWDHFSHTAGNIKDGSTGDVACDHYHRWPEDIALMKDIGIDSYCLSIAWPRIIPDGAGPVNLAGLDYYDRLVDGLLEAGITPFVKLYHWDLPQMLQERGGWANRATADAFARYAKIMADRLGDRVKHWITHNEPWVVVFLGHETGIFAPGIRDLSVALQAAHNLLLGHGLSVPIIRQQVPDAQVGVSLDFYPCTSVSDAPEDVAATQRFDAYRNRWFLDPIVGRGYPSKLWSHLEGRVDLPEIQDGDMDIISAEIDFIGVNYYSTTLITHDPQPLLQFREVEDETAELTADREIHPEGLYNILMRLHKEYAIPQLYITENGSAWPDVLTEDGRVHDTARVKFIQGHIQQAERAKQNGVPLKGMFVWSLLDNFEWASGYTLRYGICYVDYDTQKRHMKDSAQWYRDFLSGNEQSW